MFSRLALFLATLASLALAAPFSGDTNDTDPSLAPWTNLGITPDDSASFAASGVSPAEGANIIATEEALFNGGVAFTQLLPSTYTKSGTQSNMVPGAYSAAAAMGMANTADTADGVNLKLVVVVGWRRQHVGVTWRREGSGTVDLAMRFRDALWKLCPEDRPAERACSSQDEEHITDIYYNVGKSAYVGIKIASYEMPTNTRTLLIRALWGVFKEVTECDTSRYQLRGWGNHHEACREFANSADQIEVRLENTRGPGEKPGTYVDPHLRVSIQFNGKTDEGPFDCVGTQSAIWDQVRSRMEPSIRDTYKLQPEQPVDFDVLCVTQMVDGGCVDGGKGHQVICKNDQRWTNTPGTNGENKSCYWHDKCSTPSYCPFTP